MHQVGFCLIVAVLAFGNALVDLFFFEEHLCQVRATLKAIRGQIDGFSSQLPCKHHKNRVASVGD
jgi:hypothetical protein